MLAKAGLTLMCCLTLTACVEDGTHAARDRTPSPEPTAMDVRDAVLDFTACLADEGLLMTPPRFDHHGNVVRWPTYNGDAPTAVEKECARRLIKVAYEPQGAAAEFIASMQAFVDCMRAEGIQIALDGTGMRLGKGNRGPDVWAAERHCREHLPNS